MLAEARPRLALLLAIAVAVSVWGISRSRAEEADLTLIASQDGISVVHSVTGRLTTRVADGVANPDGSVIVNAVVDGGSTVLAATDPSSGEPRWTRELDGQWGVRLVAPDGETVVLGAPGGDVLYGPVPRARTRLVVSGPDGEPRRFDLAGNFEPEALAVDRGSMFVVSYLPPLAPDRYQVRRLDFSSGEVVDVFTPDAHLQEAMGGTARNQVWAPDGRRLYTLYTTVGADGLQAFVHVLDLDELWAHCIDLPSGMAATDENAVAMALSRDGDLYVADRVGGMVAEVDTDALRVARSTALVRAGGVEASAVALPGGRLLVASGSRVDVLSEETLQQVTTWQLDGDVAGLQLVAGGDEVAVVFRDRRVVVLDASSGEVLRHFDVPGTDPIEGVGGSSKRVPAPRDVLDCAC